MILGPAGCGVGSGDDPDSLDGDSSFCDIVQRSKKRMLEICQGTEVNLLCIYTHLLSC